MGKTVKKKGYYEYDPVIYPRKLFVMIDADNESIRKCFVGRDDTELDEIDFDMFSGCVYPSVMNRIDKKLGFLAVFPSRKEMKFSIIVHECSHVLDGFMNDLPLAREYGGSNEHLAYLLGWIGKCINEARLGEGKFIEIEDIKNADNP